jgi:hypothetical protein
LERPVREAGGRCCGAVAAGLCDPVETLRLKEMERTAPSTVKGERAVFSRRFG